MALQPIQASLLRDILGSTLHVRSENGYEFMLLIDDPEDNGIIKFSMTKPIRSINPPPSPVPVVHDHIPLIQPTYGNSSRINKVPPPATQPAHAAFAPTASTEVPKSVRFAFPPKVDTRTLSIESSGHSGFSKKTASPDERPAHRIRFDIRKNGDSWDIYAGDVKTKQSQFQKLDKHPADIDEQTRKPICGKKEAQMSFYVNAAGEYFLKHGDKRDVEWYKFNAN
jgi:hypothetical protein